MLVKIADIQTRSNRRAIDISKVKDLADSIKEIGLINPITLDIDRFLIAGAHRIEAFKLLGRAEIEATTTDLSGLHAELAEIDENLIRNELHFTIRGEQFSRRKEIYEELHPETKPTSKGGAFRGNQFKEVSEIISPTFAEDTAEKIGVSRRTVEQEIQIAKKLTPEAKAAVIKNDMPKTDALTLARMKPQQQKAIVDKLTTGQAATIKTAAQLIRREEIKIAPLKQTTGKYDIIYADPPWRYEFSETESRAIENQYPTMTLEDIKNIQVPCEDNAVLFLWATAPKLTEALEVMEAWGFLYRTCHSWDKEKNGMGYWFRGQHELLLLGVKGKHAAPLPENRFSSVYKEARGRHSQKPDYYYSMIERMFPDETYLEMFARQKHSDKWEVWGNQI